VRTFNSPIGDIAEELVALHYGGERGSFSQKDLGREGGKGAAAQRGDPADGSAIHDRRRSARERAAIRWATLSKT
jgi:hypothetical protein